MILLGNDQLKAFVRCAMVAEQRYSMSTGRVHDAAMSYAWTVSVQCISVMIRSMAVNRVRRVNGSSSVAASGVVFTLSATSYRRRLYQTPVRRLCSVKVKKF